MKLPNQAKMAPAPRPTSLQQPISVPPPPAQKPAATPQASPQPAQQMTAFEQEQLMLLRKQAMATQSHASMMKTLVFTVVIILGSILILAVLMNSLDAMHQAQYGGTKSR